MSFQDLDIAISYQTGDDVLGSFYNPVLAEAVSYDRVAGYFSSSELRYISQGLAHFLANDGTMRLAIGVQLTKEDVRALSGHNPIEEIVARRLLDSPELDGQRIVTEHYLQVLAWMIQEERLEVKIGVPVDNEGRLLSDGYFHAKYGILKDRDGNKVSFEGSYNATGAAWTENFEHMKCFRSWTNGAEYVERDQADFAQLWESPEGTLHGGGRWRLISLPQAVRDHLIRLAPSTPPVPPPKMQVTTATDTNYTLGYPFNHRTPTSPWPHQSLVIERAVSTYPKSYLFGDEVGLGKTIEIGLALRKELELGLIKSALLLVPASVIKQWQRELSEAIGLDIVRYDGRHLYRSAEAQDGLEPSGNPWLSYPVMLGTSQLVRRKMRREELLGARKWDVMVLDEAHHARRTGGPKEPPNSLLSLMWEMKERESFATLYLATATPMQMIPEEAWDLVALLGLPEMWAESPDKFVRYYEELQKLPKDRDWKFLQKMLASYFGDDAATKDEGLQSEAKEIFGFVDETLIPSFHRTPSVNPKLRSLTGARLDYADRWLRRHTPTKDRIFRFTRLTIKKYRDQGILDENTRIPERDVEDVFIKLSPKEREIYEEIRDFIQRRYLLYTSDPKTKGMGFIMTIYQRRLTSSFQAIRKSLQRRLDGIEGRIAASELLSFDDEIAREGDDDDIEIELDTQLDRAEAADIRRFLGDLDQMGGLDTKGEAFIAKLKGAFDRHDAVVVFTQYTDTMDWLRDQVVQAFPRAVACYSGRGGELWDAATEQWMPIDKEAIKMRFMNGDVQVLIGTDAMSEGLNLQNCGILINYDMPWNLMRAEQRVGRIDRIGSPFERISVVNYFYADTVEANIYTTLKATVESFTNVIGPAQPVIAAVGRRSSQLIMCGIEPNAIAAAIDDVKSSIDSLPIGIDEFDTEL